MSRKFEGANLIAIRIGIDRHNSRCPIQADGILMNPIDHALMGFEKLWGVPVLADTSVPTKRFRIKCEGSAENIEEELAVHLSEG
jgi:hypothetical protein